MTLFERLHMLYNETPEAGGGPAAPDPSGGGSPTPTPPAPSPEPTSTAPSTPAEPTSTGDAPWSQSLAQRFTDEAQRTAVDAYLREEIQPYITQREQELGQVGEVWNNLWDENNSVGQYLALTEEIYGPEFAQTVASQFAALAGGEPADPAAPTAGDPEAEFEQWLEQQPEPVQEMMRERMATQEDEAYEQDLAQVAATEKSITGAEHLFSRYVVAADGDMAVATQMWQQEMKPIVDLARQQEAAGDTTMVQQLGLAPANPAPPASAAPAATAPAVLGTGGLSGGTAPPTQTPGQTLDEAMSDLFAEVSGQRTDPSRGL